MQRTLYNDGVEVGQDDLRNTEDSKIKEILTARQTAMRYGVLEGLTVSVVGGNTVTIAAGRALFANGEVAALDTPLTGLTGASFSEGVSTFVGLRLTEVTSNPKPHESDPIVLDSRAASKLVAEFFVAADAASNPVALQKAITAELSDKTFVLLGEISGARGSLTVVSATPLPISKGLGGMDPYRSNQIAAENAAALVTLYGGTTDPNAPAETDIHPIASAEDHFHRSLVAGGKPKANNPHGTSSADVGADILIEDTLARYHANAILGLAPGTDAFTPDQGGSLAWGTGSFGIITVGDLLTRPDGVQERLMIRGREFTQAQLTAVLVQTQSLVALGFGADLYYILIRWGSIQPESGGQPQVVVTKKSDFDALCVLSDGSHASLNNATDTTVTDASRGERKFFVLGLINWGGSDFSPLPNKVTIPDPDGDLVYDASLPDGHPFKIPSGAKAIDLRRYGTVTNEQVQKRTLRPDRITVPIVTEENFVLHGGARFTPGKIVSVGGGLHANAAFAGNNDPLLKHLTDNDADDLWGHRHKGGTQHALADAALDGFQSAVNFVKQRDLTMTILKWSDLNGVTGDRTMGDAVGSSVDGDNKGAVYLLARTGYITNVGIHVELKGVSGNATKVRTFININGTDHEIGSGLSATGAGYSSFMMSPPFDTTHYAVAGTPTSAALVQCYHIVTHDNGTTHVARNLTVTAEFHYES